MDQENGLSTLRRTNGNPGRISRESWITFAVLAAALTALALPAVAAPKPKPVIKTTAKPSNVVHAAPDFVWIGAGGQTHPGKDFRGQPVVILVASSPEAGDLRKQAKRIEDLYLEFAAKKTVFVAAFTAAQGRVPSNVPFVIAQNGAAVAGAYGCRGTV